MFKKLKNQPPGMYLLYLMIAAVIVLGGIYALQQAWRAIFPEPLPEVPRLKDELWRFVSLPVGQADAHVIISPDGDVAVYDTALSGTAEVLYEFLETQGIERINTLVLSHPHTDHIGGAEELIKNFQVDKVWDTHQDHPIETYRSLLDTIYQYDIDYHQPKRGEKRELLPGFEVDILHPEDRYYSDINEASVVLKVNMNGVKILLTGDAYTAQEREWVRENLVGEDLTVLRVGHHGSGTSTGSQLLEATRPELAIISAPLQADSRYGHPHDEVVHRLERHEIQIYHTGKDGFIEVVSDPRGSHGNYEVITYPIEALYESFIPRVEENLYRLTRDGDDLLEWSADSSSEYSYRQDQINIYAGDESQLFYRRNTAPRLLIERELPENWFLSAGVSMPTAWGREAGLLIWKNNSSWLHWGPTGDGNRLRMQVYDGRDMYTLASTVDIYEEIGLARKEGRLIPIFRAEGEDRWRQLSPLNIPFSLNGARGGIYAKSWGDGAGYETIFKDLTLDKLE